MTISLKLLLAVITIVLATVGAVWYDNAKFAADYNKARQRPVIIDSNLGKGLQSWDLPYPARKKQ